jgi:hypothetical protein
VCSCGPLESVHPHAASEEEGRGVGEAGLGGGGKARSEELLPALALLRWGRRSVAERWRQPWRSVSASAASAASVSSCSIAASRGDPTEGELPHPRSLANGTEPHLANPCKHFNGRVSGPRAYPYRTGHGRPLEPTASSSTRNPQSATRSMGVAETSTSVPRRVGEGALKTRRRVRPNRHE